jgi:hypothetical protein
VWPAMAINRELQHSQYSLISQHSSSQVTEGRVEGILFVVPDAGLCWCLH